MRTDGSDTRVERRERRLRFGRGVAEILATLLVIAITVSIFGAFLLSISGVTGTRAYVPYVVGLVEAGTGHVADGSGHFVAVTLIPTVGLTTAEFGLRVTSPAGEQVLDSPLAAGGACRTGERFVLGSAGCEASPIGWYGVLVNRTGTIAAVYLAFGWELAAEPTTVAVETGELLEILSPVPYAGSGFVLSAIGTGASTVSGSLSL